jgi:acetyltransferase-like isoleucine patch superfamily enzyme/glycosyltransferase involved in cell wall biosynthesis
MSQSGKMMIATPSESHTPGGRCKIDVMIITFNEALNLPHCLAALQGWTSKVFVIDSGSTDGTQDIARNYGASVVHHDWPGYSRQKNWGLEFLPFAGDWVLIVDADEVITSDVRTRLVEIASRPVDDVAENGFFINRLTFFMGKAIRHCGYFPSWNLRFFKRGKAWYEDRVVHEHMVIDDPVGYIDEPMIHDDRRGLEHYVAKHNRYSTLEAKALFDEIRGRRDEHRQANITKDTRRRRWVKRHIMPYMPFPGLWRFLYMYILRLGILDGKAGLEFSRFISLYDSLVSLKLRELRRQARVSGGETRIALDAGGSGLAFAEGSDPLIPPALRAARAAGSKLNGEPAGAARPSGFDDRRLAEGQYTQMQPEASPWSFREKVGRAVWMLMGKPIFRMSFHNWYGFRARWLRLFGARIGSGVAIRPTVNIEVPWMVEVDDDATIGDHAILYSLGKIHIGKRSIISQYAHLCAGTHDYADHTFRLLRTPVNIGDDVWVGADAFIGPGVHVGSLSVVGARSSTYKDLPEHQVCVGNPAKPIKERVLR